MCVGERVCYKEESHVFILHVVLLNEEILDVSDVTRFDRIPNDNGEGATWIVPIGENSKFQLLRRLCQHVICHTKE